MKLLTKALIAKLRKNAETPKTDHMPACKFFGPSGGATWLFTELAADGDTLFGLCDLGLGYPELGYASLAELKSVRGPFGLGIERDLWFTPNKTLSAYAAEAQEKRRIVA